VGIAAGTRIVLSDGTTMPPPRAPGLEGELNITWLPGGEVTLGLDPERADGRLVLERVSCSAATSACPSWCSSPSPGQPSRWMGVWS
jgi:hypothetical protein